MADVVFFHPDNLAAIDMLAGPAPTDMPRVVSSPYLERGQVVIGPFPELDFSNMYNASPEPAALFDVVEPIKWPVAPKLHQYIPRIEHGPQFVYESAEQQWARTWLNIGKRHGASWRKPSIRGLLCCLLDPTYVHPKRIKP